MKWISVKKRVPQDGQDGLEEALDDVLISYKRVCERCDQASDNLYITVAYYYNGWNLAQPLSDDVFTDQHSNQILVTHWMPLPEPPKQPAIHMKHITKEEFKKDYPDVLRET